MELIAAQGGDNYDLARMNHSTDHVSLESNQSVLSRLINNSGNRL